MNKASNFSISTKRFQTRIVIMHVLTAIFLVLTAIILTASDNDDSAKCPTGTIANYGKCLVPKDPSQGACATGAAKLVCGRNDPNEPLGDSGPRPLDPPAKKYTPPAPPKAENSEPIIPGIIPNPWQNPK